MNHFSILLFSALLAGSAISSLSVDEPSTQVLSRGAEVYSANCSQCHQTDGSGNLHMQPPLVNDAVVMGAPEPLIRRLLQGAATIPPGIRQQYGNVMPAFDALTDEQIADVLTYIRRIYGYGAPPVTAAQVKAQRTKPWHPADAPDPGD